MHDGCAIVLKKVHLTDIEMFFISQGLFHGPWDSLLDAMQAADDDFDSGIDLVKQILLLIRIERLGLEDLERFKSEGFPLEDVVFTPMDLLRRLERGDFGDEQERHEVHNRYQRPKGEYRAEFFNYGNRDKRVEDDWLLHAEARPLHHGGLHVARLRPRRRGRLHAAHVQHADL